MSPDFLKLLKRVIEKTAEHKLRWEKTASPVKFQAAFPGSVVQIWAQESPRYTEPDIHVALLDQDGIQLEAIVDTDEDVASTIGFKPLSELYQTVRAEALGVSKAVSNALSELDKL